MNRAKRAACAALGALLLLPLCGCWSYRGLDDMTIVTGVGIDFDAAAQTYHLTCEVIDPSNTGKESGVKAKIVETQGESVMDAVRNAKKRLINRLYWGNAQILVIGSGPAQQGNIDSVIDWFLRDAECRETVGVIVSQEKTAKDLLTIEGLDSSVVAYEIGKILDDDQSATSSLRSMQLFRVYSTLKAPGEELALPAFHIVQNDGKPAVEANGEALFRGNRLAGYLTAQESKCYLFAVDGVHGGILILHPDGDRTQDYALEISDSSTDRSYSYEDGKLEFTVRTETKVYLDEVSTQADLLDSGEIGRMEKQMADDLEQQITGVIRKVQSEYGTDVFGFGSMIYKKDPQLWEKLGPDWDGTFRSVPVTVESKVRILNTAYTNRG